MYIQLTIEVELNFRSIENMNRMADWFFVFISRNHYRDYEMMVSHWISRAHSIQPTISILVFGARRRATIQTVGDRGSLNFRHAPSVLTSFHASSSR